VRRFRRLLLLLLAVAAAAALVYAWRGQWPREMREVLAYRDSLEATAGRPPAPLLANVYARRHTSLAGTWNALLDPNRQGAGLLLRDLLPRNVRPQSPAELLEFSFENGLQLQVPGDWNTQHDHLLFYRDAVWYQRRFDGKPTAAARSFLYFGAANYRCEVYLNGRRVGVHVGGFTPFNFEVTEHLRPGPNELVVLVDARNGHLDVPVEVKDWLDYGGLTRDVLLVEVPETFVRGYRLQLRPGATDVIEGWVQLDGPQSGLPVTVSVPELEVRTTARPDENGRARIELAASPALWSPRAPRLYRVVVEAGRDAVEDRIGFRTVEVRGRQLLLNGEPVFLRGVSLHEEAPNGAGRAHSPEHAETLLGWVKELDANFARLAHYPHNEHMLRTADRLGLWVWEEIPVYWKIAFGEPSTRALAEQQLVEMIDRDANRASVIFWSIGNETFASEERDAFMRGLAERARAEDPTRLVTAALLSAEDSVVPLALRAARSAAGLDLGGWRFPIEDRVGEVVDVVGVNEYIGWYYATPTAMRLPFSSAAIRRALVDNLPRVRIETGSDKPILISEFGAGARAGRHAPEEELAVFSEEYQALVYRRQLEMIAADDRIVGASPWVLKDFRSPNRLYQGVQDYWNLKGLVADDGTRKKAFFTLRDFYARLAAGE
jgi:beta-glucuronidase